LRCAGISGARGAVVATSALSLLTVTFVLISSTITSHDEPARVSPPRLNTWQRGDRGFVGVGCRSAET
jgi:hypothetical protein